MSAGSIHGRQFEAKSNYGREVSAHPMRDELLARIADLTEDQCADILRTVLWVKSQRSSNRASA